MWLVGGLYTLIGAVCLTELGTMLPEAGGYYVYARRAFGATAGFAVGWTDWLTYCAVLGYISIGLAEFSAVLVPGARRDGDGRSQSPRCISFVALQWAGVRVSSRFQEVATAIKFARFPGARAGQPGIRRRDRRAQAASTSPVASTPTLAGLIVALQAVVITFGGWQSALYFTEEDRDPRRNLPRAMIGGVLAVIGVYLLVNIALLAVLPIPSWRGRRCPAADAAQIVVGDAGRRSSPCSR